MSGIRSSSDQTVLICGGRHFSDRHQVFAILDEIHDKKPIGMIIHGAASGADTLAEAWAKSNQVMYIGVPAPWRRLGRKAGPIRNAYMLEFVRPDLVVGFPGGRGTADMIEKSRTAGIEVRDLH